MQICFQPPTLLSRVRGGGPSPPQSHISTALIFISVRPLGEKSRHKHLRGRQPPEVLALRRLEHLMCFRFASLACLPLVCAGLLNSLSCDMSGFTFRGSPLPSLSKPESRRLGVALQARLLTCLRIRAILKLEPVIVWVLLEVEQLLLMTFRSFLFVKFYFEIVLSLTSVPTKYTL